MAVKVTKFPFFLFEYIEKFFNISDNELREIDNNQRIIREEIKNDLSEQGSYSKNPNIPRAIRGSGASDTSRKGDNINTKLNSLKVTPRQKNNKGWDHDDRFHKDYE